MKNTYVSVTEGSPLLFGDDAFELLEKTLPGGSVFRIADGKRIEMSSKSMNVSLKGLTAKIRERLELGPVSTGDFPGFTKQQVGLLMSSLHARGSVVRIAKGKYELAKKP